MVVQQFRSILQSFPSLRKDRVNMFSLGPLKRWPIHRNGKSSRLSDNDSGKFDKIKEAARKRRELTSEAYRDKFQKAS